MIRLFCDFDGTIAEHDVGNEFFQTFAGERAREIVERYRTGEIHARECLQQECKVVGEITEEMFRSFVSRYRLDPHVPEFVRFCSRNEIPLMILSDGLDLYVEQLLAMHGLQDVPYAANHASFVKQKRSTVLVPEFPFRDEHCDLCGNCKRNHMVTQSEDDDTIVYVGDGMSDRCPVRYADVVFAKGSLIASCQQQNISYYEFRHFGDVQKKLEEIISRRIKRRREAFMARRDVFIAE